MKYKLGYSTEFDKDVSKLKKRDYDLSHLKEAIKLLEKHGKLPKTYRTHYLYSAYKQCLECHLLDDWLLIWKQSKENIYFIRTGTHSDLF